MKTARYICNMIMCALLAAAFTACDKDAHENEYPLGNGNGAFIVGLQSDKEVRNINLFIFGEDGTTVQRNDYTDPKLFASEHFPVRAGTYTVVVVANMTDEGLPAQTTVADLAEWLREHAAAYPDMLTASAQEEVAAGEVKRLLLTLEDGTSGIALSTVRLQLTVPGKEMPAYTTRAAADGDTHRLRCVAEVYSGDTRVHRRVQLCEEQPDGTWFAGLSLLPGDYALRLWADWTTDGTTADKYYNADDLAHVTVLTDGYVANGQTDEKDAYHISRLPVTVSGETQDVSETLTRPFARYRLVATDVDGYQSLIAGGDDLPPIEDLSVSVSYETFFPTGFNVAEGKPNDALTGISYTAGIVPAEGYDPGKARQVGADFVLTNGEESFVTVTVRMVNRNTGETVSTVTGVRVPYRRGHLTTVSGAFLTAGRTSGGVDIDTDWGDEIVIPF